MKIKTLLLGSAAAMVTAISAQAADAIVVEPEPVEYVRVCDAYGSGYFYIPGTETCLKFSGYVRTYFASRDYDSVVTAGGKTRKSWISRARLEIDTKNETDWGTLSARFRIQSDGNALADGVDGGDMALISLAGFRAGVGDAYFATNHGDAGVAGIEGVEGEDGPFGAPSAQLFDYTFAPIDGLAITVGVEDITAGASAASGVAFNTNPNSNGDSLDGQGNFYAGFNYNVSVFTLAFTAANDDNSTVANRGWAYKASVDIDVSEFVPGGNIHAKYFWEDLEGPAGGGAHTDYSDGADNTLQIGFHFNAMDNLVVGATYYHQEDTTAIGQDRDFVAVGFDWEAVSQLQIFGSYAMSDTTSGGTTEDYDQFVIGMRRNF